jgi:hypothetical protein
MENTNNTLIDIPLLDKEMTSLDTKPPQEITDETSQYLIGDPSYDEGMDLLIAYKKYEKSEKSRSFIVNHAKKHVLDHWKIINTCLQTGNISAVQNFSEKKELASFVLPILYVQLCSLLPNHQTYIPCTTKIDMFKKNTFIAQLLDTISGFVWMNDYVHDRTNMLVKTGIRLAWGRADFFSIDCFFSSWLPGKESLKNFSVSPVQYMLGIYPEYQERLLPFCSKTGLIGTNTILFCMQLGKIGIDYAYDIKYIESVHASKLKNLLDLSAHDISHAMSYSPNIKKYNISYETLLNLLIANYKKNGNQKHLEYMRLLFYIVHEMVDIDKASFEENSKSFIYCQLQNFKKKELHNAQDSYTIRTLNFNLIDSFNILKIFDQKKADDFMNKEGLYITEDSLLQSTTKVISKNQLINFHEYIHQAYCDIWNRFKEEYKEEVGQALPFKS